MMGENVDRAWSRDHAAAWEGFLDVARHLRRAADGVLEPIDGLSVSMLGIMGRLARVEHDAPETDLAEAMGLSFSRVSRLIDTLESRELVGRRPCPSDARATNVTLTPAGLALTRRAQDAVFAFVEEQFFQGVDQDEIATLAGRLHAARRPARRNRGRLLRVALRVCLALVAQSAPGACGKTRVVPQNLRPKPEPTGRGSV